MTYQATISGQRKERPLRTSEMLREFAHSVSSERVSVAEIAAALGGRGLGVLIAVFALPNILSLPIPFGNVAIGVPTLIFAVQLTLGFERLMIPKVIAHHSISSDMLKAIAPRVAGILSWFEGLLRPRFPLIAGPHTERAFGLLCVALAVVAMLPIPFGHNLPALGLVLIGLGLIERDGLAIVGGAFIGIAGSALLGLVLLGLAGGVGFLLGGFG
jgi:hypothetical protein